MSPLLLALGCTLLEAPPEPDCKIRSAAWPDADGDGVGDATEVYVGCEVPEGWVQVPPRLDTGHSGDTGGHSGAP